MKKIVIVNNTLGEGGAEKVLIDILNRFNYDKYEVNLLLINNDGVHIDKLNKNVKMKYIYPNLNPRSYIMKRVWNFFKYRTMKHLYKLIYILYVGMNSDVEIAFLEGEPTKFVSRSLNKKSKKIAWVHTDLIKCRTSELNNKDEDTYKHFNNIVCVSNSSRDAFCEIYKDFSHNVDVIYNLIEVDRINKLANEPIEHRFNKPTIISIGRLTKIKRFDLIIKAHKILIEKGVEHDLLILGVGEEKENLLNMIKDLGVENTVKLLGFVYNPYPYIKKADLLTIASEFEGFSLVIGEAISLGKAIVSTDNGGATELLNNGEFGKIVKINHLESLAEAIESIIIDENLKIKYEKKSKQRANIFKSEEIIKKIYELVDC